MPLTAGPLGALIGPEVAPLLCHLKIKSIFLFIIFEIEFIYGISRCWSKLSMVSTLTSLSNKLKVIVVLFTTGPFLKPDIDGLAKGMKAPLDYCAYIEAAADKPKVLKSEDCKNIANVRQLLNT
jgi:hypothetical protein